MSTFKRLFLDHPATIDEGYFEHLLFAFKFSGRLFRMGFAALVHGVVPATFETTASSGILKLSEEIRIRRQLMASASECRQTDHNGKSNENQTGCPEYRRAGYAKHAYPRQRAQTIGWPGK